MQTNGIDYLETFSLVVKLTTVKVLLSLVAAKGWYLHQLDVNIAFLHRDLYEDVYMKAPPGLACSDPTLVYKIQKSLYRLKEASR